MAISTSQNDSDFSVTKVTDSNGVTHDNVFLARTPKLVEEAQRLANVQYALAFENQLFAQDEKDPVSAGMLVELQTIQAQQIAGHLIEEKMLPDSKGTTIPIIYSPDSGIHIAEGIARGIEWFSDAANAIHAVRKGWDVSDEIMEQAKHSGHIILCDGVMCFGDTIASLLSRIPDNVGTKEKPLEIIIITHFLHTNPKVSSDQMDAFSIERLGWVMPENATLKMFFADIGDVTRDRMDIGDMIANNDHPVLTDMQRQLTKRISPYRNFPDHLERELMKRKLAQHSSLFL